RVAGSPAAIAPLVEPCSGHYDAGPRPATLRSTSSRPALPLTILSGIVYLGHGQDRPPARRPRRRPAVRRGPGAHGRDDGEGRGRGAGRRRGRDPDRSAVGGDLLLPRYHGRDSAGRLGAGPLRRPGAVDL